jgi:hypothetical protein
MAPERPHDALAGGARRALPPEEQAELNALVEAELRAATARAAAPVRPDAPGC